MKIDRGAIVVSLIVSSLILNLPVGSAEYGLNHWADHRHPRKNQRWLANKYWWMDQAEGWTFAAKTPDSIVRLPRHNATAIKRQVKIQGKRSPYDADWVDWSSRMGRHPQVNQRVALLLRHKGICPFCRLFFKDRDLLELDHILPRSQGGRAGFKHLQLLHRHCHDAKSANDGR